MYKISIIVLPLAISGCVSTPQEAADVEPRDVREFVHCEIYNALNYAKEKYPKLKEFASKYEVNLQKKTNLSGGVGSLSWIIPASPKPYTLGLSAGVADSGTAATSFSGKVSSKDDSLPSCSKTASDTFRGSLGIKEWMDRTVSTELKPDTFGRTYEFTITYDAKLNPAFAIVNLSGAASLGGTRQNMSRLVVSFYEVKETPPQKVQIVGADGKILQAVIPGQAGDDREGERFNQFQLLNILNATE